MVIFILSIYLTIGTCILIDDARQPIYNQPHYIRKSGLLPKLTPIFLWPLSAIHILIMERFRLGYVFPLIFKSAPTGIIVFAVYYFAFQGLARLL
jgi:hypothetical protein